MWEEIYYFLRGGERSFLLGNSRVWATIFCQNELSRAPDQYVYVEIGVYKD